MAIDIQYTVPRRLLNPATGYLSGYDYSLNPYAGCVYACSYCYVRQMPVAQFRGKPWGTWVDVKQEAAALFRKELRNAKRKGGTALFMSSSTDPYQPVEYKEKITRSLLEVMVDDPPDFVFVQTRSPLVTRDTDLLLQLGCRVRVSMTIETDRDDIRKAFSPAAPPIEARLKALEQLGAAGVPIQATIAPLLPCSDDFPRLLAGVVNKVCLDDFFRGDGSQGKRTARLRIDRIFAAMHEEDWYHPRAIERLEAQLKLHFSENQIGISQQGFAP